VLGRALYDTASEHLSDSDSFDRYIMSNRPYDEDGGPARRSRNRHRTHRPPRPSHSPFEAQSTRAPPPSDQQNFVNHDASSSLFMEIYQPVAPSPLGENTGQDESDALPYDNTSWTPNSPVNEAHVDGEFFTYGGMERPPRSPYYDDVQDENAGLFAPLEYTFPNDAQNIRFAPLPMTPRILPNDAQNIRFGRPPKPEDLTMFRVSLMHGIPLIIQWMRKADTHNLPSLMAAHMSIKQAHMDQGDDVLELPHDVPDYYHTPLNEEDIRPPTPSMESIAGL
jgi:hypothetical protein